MSAYPASASVATESDLFAGYVPFQKAMPCVCGGWITADIECPAGGVREHNASALHQAWRERVA